MNYFHEWCAQDIPLRITEDDAFRITEGKVGRAGSDDVVSLASVALRYAIAQGKRD